MWLGEKITDKDWWLSLLIMVVLPDFKHLQEFTTRVTNNGGPMVIGLS
jgi:hypothetical protein